MPPDITVAAFRVCRCNFMAGKHLSIDYNRVPLTEGSAVAISYTWGEFHRRRVLIGHNQDLEAVRICLGIEWPTKDVISGLANIHRAYSRDRGCWIDQLCIPQDDESARREAIMRIPQIFRTFKVAVFMCGKPCRHFGTVAGLFVILERLGKSSPSLEIIAMKLLLQRKLTCGDLAGISSYFNRLWTQQEFIYGVETSVVWSSGSSKGCVSQALLQSGGNLDLNDLSQYTKSLVLQEQENAVSALRSYGEKFFHGAAATQSLHSGQPTTDIGKQSKFIGNTIRFLIGNMSARTEKPIICDDPDLNHLHYFWWSLQELSGAFGQRSATKSRDYVAAVWVDCPRFELPKKYIGMSASQLLEDAVEQAERNFACTPATTFPMYGPISEQAWVALRSDGSLDIDFMPSSPPQFPCTALGLVAEIYPKARGPQHAYRMALEINRMRRYWTWNMRYDVCTRMQALPNEKSAFEAFTGDNEGGYCSNLYQKISSGIKILTNVKNGGPEYSDNEIEQWAISVPQSFDSQEFLFAFVCLALGLNPRLCRELDLKLVRTNTRPLLLGLQKKPIIGPEQYPQSKRKTVLMSTSTYSDEVFYNLRDFYVTNDRSPAGKYKTDIVWLPTSDPGVLRHIQGYARHKINRI